VVIDQGPDGKQLERKVTVGLVGMHIGHKSKTSPQWIWSTFEQVDNLDVDAVAHPKLNPSFVDPNCPMCAVNQQPQKVKGVYPRIPTQAWRGIPDPRRQDRPEPSGPGGPEGPGLGLAVLSADRHPVADRSDGAPRALERRPAQRHRQQAGR
jgi:hypothetical protein